MQIRFRRRELTDAEQKTLRSLRRTSIQKGGKRAAQIELSCTILLAERANTSDATEHLTAEELEDFMKWPIWNLVEERETVAPRNTAESAVPQIWLKQIEGVGGVASADFSTQ